MARTSVITVLLSVTMLVLFHAAAAYGTLIAVIVDDQDPSISYTPDWHIGQICAGCAAKLDESQVYNGTWHDNTYLRDGSNTPQNATFSFTGSAISVYGAQQQLSGRISADVLFYIDDHIVSSYTFTPTGPQDVVAYGQLLFSYDSLKEAPHTLMLQNGQVDGAPSVVLFDYLVYTTNTSDTNEMVATTVTDNASTVTVTETHRPEVGNRVDSAARIATICLGSILFTTLLVVAWMAWMIRRQRAGVGSDPTQAKALLLPTKSAWDKGLADDDVIFARPFTQTSFTASPPYKTSVDPYNSLYLEEGKTPNWVLTPAQSVSAEYRAGQEQARSELSEGDSGNAVGGDAAPPA